MPRKHIELPAHIAAIVEVLLRYGERFHGGRAAVIAREWDDCGFTARDVESWCDIGVWDAETAEALRDAGLTPDDVCAAADRMVEQHGADAYTDGCPIYAACNGDIGPKRIIDAHRNS